MGTVLAGLVWVLSATLAAICFWRAFHTKPADVRRELFRQGRPELAPGDWVGLGLVLLILAGASGYAMATGWTGEYIDPVLAPLTRRF